ncbi:MAG TPA: hypothetical protein VI094_19515 [Propionibacteriaceae bacterium]
MPEHSIALTPDAGGTLDSIEWQFAQAPLAAGRMTSTTDRKFSGGGQSVADIRIPMMLLRTRTQFGAAVVGQEVVHTRGWSIR